MGSDGGGYRRGVVERGLMDGCGSGVSLRRCGRGE